MGVTAKIEWDSSQEQYEVTSGTTDIGFADTLPSAKSVARDWFKELMAA